MINHAFFECEMMPPERAVASDSRKAAGWMLTSFPIITPQTRVSTAVSVLDDHGVSALPVCEAGRFVGLVDDKALLRCTPSELQKLFREAPTLLAKLVVAQCAPQLLDTAVSPDTSIEEAAALMARHAARLIAVTQSERPIGLLSWSCVLGPAMVGLNARALRVQDRMITRFPTVLRRTSVAWAIRLLQAQAAPALPVCENGRFLGILDENALLRLTPSATTTDTIDEVRGRLANVHIEGRFVPMGPFVEPGALLAHAASLMMTEAEEVLPVLDTGRLVGLLLWDHVMAAAVGGMPQGASPSRRNWLFWM